MSFGLSECFRFAAHAWDFIRVPLCGVQMLLVLVFEIVANIV